MVSASGHVPVSISLPRAVANRPRKMAIDQRDRNPNTRSRPKYRSDEKAKTPANAKSTKEEVEKSKKQEKHPEMPSLPIDAEAPSYADADHAEVSLRGNRYRRCHTMLMTTSKLKLDASLCRIMLAEENHCLRVVIKETRLFSRIAALATRGCRVRKRGIGKVSDVGARAGAGGGGVTGGGSGRRHCC